MHYAKCHLSCAVGATMYGRELIKNKTGRNRLQHPRLFADQCLGQPSLQVGRLEKVAVELNKAQTQVAAAAIGACCRAVQTDTKLRVRMRGPCPSHGPGGILPRHPDGAVIDMLAQTSPGQSVIGSLQGQQQRCMSMRAWQVAVSATQHCTAQMSEVLARRGSPPRSAGQGLLLTASTADASPDSMPCTAPAAEHVSSS